MSQSITGIPKYCYSSDKQRYTHSDLYLIS